MEALTSSCSSSSSKQFFVKSSSHRNRRRGEGLSPPSKTLFTTRTELGFFRFQKCNKNVDFSHSISLQLIKSMIQPAAVSCPTTTLFPSSEVAEGDMMMTTEEAPTQEETYTGGKTVHVKFLLQKECTFGEQFLLVGDDPIFGMWNPSDAIPLDWSEGHLWSVGLDIPVEKLIRFKFILKGTKEEELVWQPDPDRILQTWETKNTIVVSENWEIAETQTIIEEEPGANPIQEDKISSELNLSEDMSNPKENLVVVDKLSNPKQVLLIEDNMSYPKEELLIADNISNPKEKQTVGQNQDVVGSNNISNPKEEQTVGQNQDVAGSNSISNPKEEQTVENQDVVGSNSIAVAVDRPTSVDDNEDDLVDYEGEPLLVPGLAPFPTTVPKGSLPAVVDTISTKGASVELNGNDIEVEDGNIPVLVPVLVPGLAPFPTTVPKGSLPAVVDTISTKGASVELNGNDIEVEDGNIPVLVPGLAPFPTTVPKGSLPAVVDTISTKGASVELNGNDIEVEDGNIPEKFKKKDLDENTLQENTTVMKISDDGPEKEKNVPEELPLVQLEQTSFLELLRSDFHWANRRVRQLLKDLGLFSF